MRVIEVIGVDWKLRGEGGGGRGGREPAIKSLNIRSLSCVANAVNGGILLSCSAMREKDS